MTSPIEPVVQYPVVSLKADWLRNDFSNSYADLSAVVSDISVERSITSDLPTEVGLVEGYAAAQLTVTLEGFLFDGTEVLNAFAPYRTDSPLYGIQFLTTPIVCDMGLATDSGTTMTRQFTGRLRSLKVNSAQRTVTITALDDADRLRASITLPAYGQLRSDIISHGYKFDINTQAIIDYVLRCNGIYASPPPTSTAQLSITGHGWLTTEIGRSMYPNGTCTPITDDTWWVPGPFNMLAVRGIWDNIHTVTVECYTQDQFNPVSGAGVGVAMWIHVGNSMPDIIPNTSRTLVELYPAIDAAIGFKLRVVNNPGITTVVAALTNSSTDLVTSVFTIPFSTTQWIHCAAHWQFGTNGTLTLTTRINSVTATSTTTNPTPGSIPYLLNQMKVVAHTDARDWSNLQVWYDYNPPTTWPGENWSSQATIGIGNNRLSHLPDVVNTDSWQVIRDVTTAEFGTSGFDALGRFRFTPRTSPPDPTNVTKTITADRALLDLGLETSADAVRNIVTTETVAAYLAPGSIVDSKDVITWESPVGVSYYKVILPYGTIGSVKIQSIPQYTTTSWDAATDLLEGFVAVQSVAPDVEISTSAQLYVHFIHTNDQYIAQIVPPDPTAALSAKPTGNRVGLLTVQNYTSTPVRFATTSGSPALRVQGWALNPEPNDTETITNPGSVTTIGERVFSIPTSPYRQLIGPLRPVAGQLLAQLSNPLPVVDSVSTIGDPALSLNDTGRITEPRGQGSFRATVVGIVRTFTTTEGLLDRLTVRPIAPPGLGISDDPELGLADSTLIAAP